jgi:hypothetical protein
VKAAQAGLAAASQQYGTSTAPPNKTSSYWPGHPMRTHRHPPPLTRTLSSVQVGPYGHWQRRSRQGPPHPGPPGLRRWKEAGLRNNKRPRETVHATGICLSVPTDGLNLRLGSRNLKGACCPKWEVEAARCSIVVVGEHAHSGAGTSPRHVAHSLLVWR